MVLHRRGGSGKRGGGGLALAVVIAAAFAAAAFGRAASAQPAEGGDARRVERLAGLARLWGAVKYFHPWLAYKDIDWDAALIATIPLAESADSPEAYRAAIERLMSFVGDSEMRVDSVRTEEKAAPSSAPAPGAEAQPAVRRVGDDVAVVVATDFARIGSLPPGSSAFKNAFSQAIDASGGLILDLRRAPLPAVDAPDDISAWELAQSFKADFPALLPFDLPLGSVRTRFHSGYAPQSGITSGGYYSGFILQDREVLKAIGKSARAKPIAILVNRGTRGLDDLFAALRSAGLATIIRDGDEAPAPFLGSAYALSLPDGVTCTIRLEEIVNVDGTIGFEPDFVVHAGSTASSTAGDAAMDLALRVLRGEAKPEPRKAMPASGAAVRKLESPYPDMTYPSREYRLLALFRFWNVIHYFYPYKELLDRPWDEVLREFIPKLEAAKDATEYALTVSEMVTRIEDTHGFVWSPILNDYFGTHAPPLVVRTLAGEGATVVTYVGDEALAADGRVRVGDTIVSIDGEAVAARAERLGRSIAASTPQALRWRVDMALLAGREGSTVALSVRGADGTARDVMLPRSAAWWAARQKMLASDTRPVFTILKEGYGYVDLTRLTVDQVNAALDAVQGAPAVIFDLRGYPNGTAWELGPRLTEKEVIAARFRRALVIDPDPSSEGVYGFAQTVSPSPLRKYHGKVVVLINEEAISQAEHTCLYLEATARDVTFVGTPTSGANGDVTNVPLPGGISVSFSGHDVRHADGRQLQRRGIQPDVRVEPTVAGIRAGRDEVLEAAIGFLKQGGSR